MGAPLGNRNAVGHRREQQKGVPVANTWLTSRQHTVMTLYSRGKRRADIARLIGISDRTVDSHVRHTLIKLGADSIHQAVAIVAVSNAMDDRR